MRLTERQQAFLGVLATAEPSKWGLGPGEVFAKAYPDAPYRGRRDAGATRTLDNMSTRGLVIGRYHTTHSTSRCWQITDAGRQELSRARELV